MTTQDARPGYRITKVYTRNGDGGTTRLVGGQEIPKHHPRLTAFGTVDELQVAMAGAALAAQSASTAPATAKANPDKPDQPLLGNLAEHLIYLQNRLFTLSGDLATRIEDRWDGMPLVGAGDVTYMENLIDALNAPLPPLKDFILPGGHPLVVALHQCRVVCRRAEREVEALAATEPIGDAVRPFLNRLSDLFFVMARAAARAVGLSAEPIWKRDLPQPPLPGGAVGEIDAQ